jgi:hypothetical protein
LLALAATWILLAVVMGAVMVALLRSKLSPPNEADKDGVV